jgi:hypothetical protein
MAGDTLVDDIVVLVRYIVCNEEEMEEIGRGKYESSG